MSQSRWSWTAFLVNLVLSSWFLDVWTSPNSVSRALPTMTLCEEGTLAIDSHSRFTGDKSRIGGHTYSDKPPLPSFLMVPVYGAMQLAGIARIDERAWNRYPMRIFALDPERDARPLQFGAIVPLLLASSFFCGSLPFAIVVTLALGRARRARAPLPSSVLVMLAFYGSYLFVYSGTYFGHLLAGLFLLLGYILLKRGRWLAAGALVGLGFLCDYPVALALPVWGLLIWADERSWRKIARFAAGAVPALASILAYNRALTGHPLKTLTAYHDLPVFGESLARNYGFSLRNLGFESMWGLSLSPYMGLFVFAPVLVVVLVELARGEKKRGRPLARLTRSYAAVLAVAYFFLIASFFSWWGGWAYGPRYLIPPACVLLYAGVGFLAERSYSKLLFAVATGAGWTSAWLAKATLLYMIPDDTTATSFAPAPAWPVSEYLLPAMAAGRFNGGSFPTIAFGLHPGVSAALWPALFAAGVFVLVRRPAAR